MMACFRGHSHLPVLLVLLMFMAIFICYGLSVYLGHVPPLFPRISNTGAKQPESSVFSEFLNISAVFLTIIIYFRAKLIHEITQGMERCISRTTNFNFAIGLLVCFGVTLVANFQDDEPYVRFIHYLGAGIVFFIGNLYIILDTILTFRMCPTYNGRYIWIIRLTIAVLTFLSLLTMMLVPFIFLKFINSEYTANLIGAFSEWTLVACIGAYFLTYTADFQKFNIRVNLILNVSHLNQIPYEDPDEHTRLLV